MSKAKKNCFSEAIIAFREMRLPEEVHRLAGYAALINVYDLSVPLPRKLFATSDRNVSLDEEGWVVLPMRQAPAPSLQSHLIFALKYEGLDLAILKRLFMSIEPEDVISIVRDMPTGSYTRRIWFLYEWLTGTVLDLPNAKTGAYVDVVNVKQQYAITGKNSTRHRVKNNLAGTPEFCPMVFKTPKLEKFEEMDLEGEVNKLIGTVPKDIMARTAAFLLLKDSKSSFIIEGEQPPQDRIQRWGRVIGEAGKNPIDIDEIRRLQDIVIGDARFVKKGLRQEGGFVGEHDRDTGMPLPDHISARPEDLLSLLQGMMSYGREGEEHSDAIITAAIIAFGFVYTHPFEDGNGRIHRYLIHHILALYQFSPPQMTFPISSAILENLEGYRVVLESYSKRLLPVIEWEQTSHGNVKVLNDSADFYRFFDATPHAEFLYRCVAKTIAEDLPEEIYFLKHYDQFSRSVDGMIDMPHQKIDLLFRFLKQNQGKLSRRALTQEFAGLKAKEVKAIEGFYKNSFTV